MHQWATDLFDVCRSITGPGVRQTLEYFIKILPELSMHSVPTGTTAFDWKVPDEWFIYDAFIENEFGERIIDFKNNNLHVVSYSIPVDQWLELEELDSYLHSLIDQPEAIPYITSYYKRSWGFCISHKQKCSLKKGKYRVYINSELKPGVLNYAEVVLPGESKQEVLLSTYICHPSMANNELSGPIMALALAKWLKTLEKRKYTYRIVFAPETIGSIVYLSKNYKHLRENMIAGYVLTCIGDERVYSFVPSRYGDTFADKVALNVLAHKVGKFDRYTYLDRGSDERQYCSPGIDLPVCSIMRSKYGEYPEYHTSLDDLNFVTAQGLQQSYEIMQNVIQVIEYNNYYKATNLCEPQLGKYGLYPSLSTRESVKKVKTITNILAYSDGTNSLLELSEILNTDPLLLHLEIKKLVEKGLIKQV